MQLTAPWDTGFLGAARLCPKVHTGLRGKVLELPTPKPKELSPPVSPLSPVFLLLPQPPESQYQSQRKEPGGEGGGREEKGREGGRDETRKVKMEQSEKEEINSRIETQEVPVQNLCCI